MVGLELLKKGLLEFVHVVVVGLEFGEYVVVLELLKKGLWGYDSN